MHIYKQIIREYEKDREKAEQIKEERLQKAYELEPRIEQIDQDLLQIGIDITKIAFKKNDTTAIINLQNTAVTLLKEKEDLIFSNFGANYLNTYKCNLCEDTGFVELDRCNCLKQRLIDKYYNISNLKELLEIENFDTFDIRLFSDIQDKKLGISPRENMQLIYTNALDFVNNFQKDFNNLFFYGDSGLGKTFLCNCIAKDVLAKGLLVVYQSASDMFKIIEKERFNKDEETTDMVSFFYNAPLLIIDDLGTEFSTIVTQSELFNIINLRYINKKSTIISTNLSFENLSATYSTRLVSRFFGNYKHYKFIGSDIRIIKKRNLLN